MRLAHAAAAAVLSIAGALSSACAQAHVSHARPDEERRALYEKVQALEQQMDDLKSALQDPDLPAEKTARLKDQLNFARSEWRTLRMRLQEKDPDGPPPQDPERRERIERLESQIREMEGAMKTASPEQKDDLKKRITDCRIQLKELLAQGPPPDHQDARHEKMRRLEMEMADLQRMLERKDIGPEERKAVAAKLDATRARMSELRDELKRGEPWWGDRKKGSSGTISAFAPELDLIILSVGRDHGVNPGDEFALHRAEMFVGKVVIDRVDRLWSSGKLVLKGKEAPRVGDSATFNSIRPGPGPSPGQDSVARDPHPFDPELHKLHQAAQELDRESLKISMKLRSLPADSKEDRAELQKQLKDAVTRLFDLREKARVREVEMIKARLDELTQLLEKRKVNRDAIIEKRIRQLSGVTDELDW